MRRTVSSSPFGELLRGRQCEHIVECSVTRAHELIGLHASGIVAEAENPADRCRFERNQQQSDHHREWQFRRKDGSIFLRK